MAINGVVPTLAPRFLQGDFKWSKLWVLFGAQSRRPFTKGTGRVHFECRIGGKEFDERRQARISKSISNHKEDRDSSRPRKDGRPPNFLVECRQASLGERIAAGPDWRIQGDNPGERIGLVSQTMESSSTIWKWLGALLSVYPLQQVFGSFRNTARVIFFPSVVRMNEICAHSLGIIRGATIGTTLMYCNPTVNCFVRR